VSDGSVYRASSVKQASAEAVSPSIHAVAIVASSSRNLARFTAEM